MGTHTPHILSEPELFLLAEKTIRHRARLLTGLFGFTEHDIPDIQQELFLELYNRKENFNPEKSKETTFITRVVESKILDLIKQRQAKRRDWRRYRQSLNQTVTLPGIGVIEKIETLEFEPDSDPLLVLDVRRIIILKKYDFIISEPFEEYHAKRA